jgi:hypothetical protein
LKINRNKEQSISLEYLKSILDYNQETGIFTWKVKKGIFKKGDIAGYLETKGYLGICINYVRYRLHRIAYFYKTGSWPKGQIDHINGIRSDNRFCNLRDVSQNQNMSNSKKHKDNLSGYKGVSWHKKDKKWRCRICFNGKHIFIGNFNTKEEAHESYKKAAVQFFGEFARLE